jgi:hypothetical protein
VITRRRGGTLFLFGENCFDVARPRRTGHERDLEPVRRVVGADLGEDQLDDLLSLVVGHDQLIVDDRVDSLALKRD